ncbi:MAG: GNAT family N-acetyltransferase, partial [Rhodothermales bacterium]|nr:GNAT family N-acetyltransferase [Rhodothermales bacterium]
LRNVVDGCLTSPVGYVEGIFVDEGHRGCGVARELLLRSEEWFRQKECTEAATDAEIDNLPAQRFHEHMGFLETYRVVEYRKDL